MTRFGTIRNLLVLLAWACLTGLAFGQDRAVAAGQSATTPAPVTHRIKDIVEIQGVRSNPLTGYGLVVGLDGTGDDSPISRRALANLLRRSGLPLDSDEVSSSNIASVLVTAE